MKKKNVAENFVKDIPRQQCRVKEQCLRTVD
jgi:hypothetical protein